MTGAEMLWWVPMVGMLLAVGAVLIRTGKVLEKVEAVSDQVQRLDARQAETDRYMRNGPSTKAAAAESRALEAGKVAETAIGIARKAEDGVVRLDGEMNGLRALCAERHHGGARA